jgi:hypothetical protein
MEAIKFRTLTLDEEIGKFLCKFETYVRVKLPYDYSARSRIVAGFIADEMVAGYMLVTKQGFRSLMFVPDKVKNEHEFFKNDQYEMMEVNGFWISPRLKTAADRYQVWMNLIWDTFMAKKQYVLMISDLRNENAKHLYSLTGTQLLYEGPSMLMSGAKTHAGIRLSYTRRWQLLLNIPKYWLEYKSRERRFNKKLKERSFSRMAKVG